MTKMSLMFDYFLNSLDFHQIEYWYKIHKNCYNPFRKTMVKFSQQRVKVKFLYFPWVCRGMGWIYGWGLFLETNCQYPRLILHNILHINQDFRRGESTKSIFIWKLYFRSPASRIPSKLVPHPTSDICYSIML